MIEISVLKIIDIIQILADQVDSQTAPAHPHCKAAYLTALADVTFAIRDQMGAETEMLEMRLAGLRDRQNRPGHNE